LEERSVLVISSERCQIPRKFRSQKTNVPDGGGAEKAPLGLVFLSENARCRSLRYKVVTGNVKRRVKARNVY
jgi:hypothetical protein